MIDTSVSLWIAFLAGIVSFASPCVVPLVPSYIGFIAGGVEPKDNERPGKASLRAFRRTVFFVAGFGIVFAVMGIVFAGGGLILGSALNSIRIVAGILVIVFGLNTIFNFIPFLNYEKRAQVSARPATALGAMVVGMAFGAGWTPCIGPILASILFMAGTSQDAGLGVLFLSVYTLGLGLPFLVLSLGLDRFKPVLQWMKRKARPIKYTSGILLVLMGLLIAFGQMASLVRVSAQAGQALLEWTAANTWAAIGIAVSLYFAAGTIPWFVRLHRLKTSATHAGKPVSALVWTVLISGLIIVETAMGPLLLAGIGNWLGFQGI